MLFETTITKNKLIVTNSIDGTTKFFTQSFPLSLVLVVNNVSYIIKETEVQFKH